MNNLPSQLGTKRTPEQIQRMREAQMKVRSEKRQHSDGNKTTMFWPDGSIVDPYEYPDMRPYFIPPTENWAEEELNTIRDPNITALRDSGPTFTPKEIKKLSLIKVKKPRKILNRTSEFTVEGKLRIQELIDDD